MARDEDEMERQGERETGRDGERERKTFEDPGQRSMIESRQCDGVTSESRYQKAATQ
jgi:hypothetical protein